MRPIVIDGLYGVVGRSVGRSVCHDREPRKTAEPIEMRFAKWTRVDPRKHVLDGGPASPWEGGNFAGRDGPLQSIGTTVHVRRRCGLLSNYFDHLLLLLKPNSITPDSSELAPNMFGASAELVRSWFEAEIWPII